MFNAAMWTFFLFFLLDLTNFSQALGFWKYHVDYPKTKVEGLSHEYCNVMMRKRTMIVRGRCVNFNTFIHEPNSTIINICSNPESCFSTSWAKCNKSSRTLKVTYCFTKSYARPPNCQYKAKANFSIIKVICMKGVPVYLFQS
uniref:Ribonuclease A-domain domain-containing protein n=1 Tax=Sarcophilus harrisii TaxID=9305 RepID=G3VIK1_SARHA